MSGIKPPRTPWRDFPDVLHAPETQVKKHRAYSAAKSGDADAAQELVADALSTAAVQQIGRIVAGHTVIAVSAHAYEQLGVNAIPEVLAEQLRHTNGVDVDASIVQTNVVAHTGADGFSRLARQAAFAGPVHRGALYFLVDDFIGQGGTLANLRGYIEAEGGIAIGATALTRKPYSAKLKCEPALILALRAKHGKEFEDWWIKEFDHTFDCLTQSEARYLERSESAVKIRDRIAAAKQG